MKLFWTDESLDKLSAIDDFISRDSPQSAENFVKYLIERGESISENPQLGRIVPEILNPEIREIIAKGYRIVYRIKQDRVEILTVFEGHKLLKLDGNK